jgi:2-methylcitrate dehydratase PrpD
MHLAERLAEFAVQAQRRKPPAAAMAAARLRLLDGLAVAFAALASEGVVKPRAALGLFGEGGASSAVGEALPRSAAAAALHNGLLIHGLEYDDTHIGAVVHGAPVVLPAVLAIAERDGKSGAEALAALCAGWEVLARIGAALRGALQAHGFQATSVAGPLAAAAAAASLSGLDARRTAHAIGIAGSQSSGVFEFLAAGATSKALHGGWAAMGGLVSAALAADGMTGPASILEGKAGIFSAFARAPELAARMESQLADLGERWAVTEARPKAAPCCHYILAFIEALEEVLGQGVAPVQIRAIRCTVDPRQAQLICEPWAQKLAPPSGFAAKWSLPFCLAARALRGPVSVALFERPLEAEVLAFARRIEWTPKEDGFPDRYPGRLSVALADGRTLESYVPDVLGGADRPFPEAQLIAKFRAAAGSVLPASEVAGLLREVQALEQADSITALGAYLRAARRRTAAGAREAARVVQ